MERTADNWHERPDEEREALAALFAQLECRDGCAPVDAGLHRLWAGIDALQRPHRDRR